MKVCILGDSSSVHLQRIVPGLVARDVEVTVLWHKPTDIPGATVKRFEVPKFGISYPYRYQQRHEQYLRRLMRSFDVVHVHFLHEWGLTPEIASEGCLAVTPWGSDLVLPPGETPPSAGLIQSRIDLLSAADCVTAWGPSFARTIAKYASIDVDRIDLLPLGVDLDLFRPPVQTRTTDVGRTFKIGFFKGFREVYGATYLMRAMPTIIDTFPNTRFHLIGDGPELLRCKELSGLYEVDGHVKWIKRQPHANIPNHLAGWDLSVIPSVCESFGAAALESSAMRVPVVASNVGGLPDTVIDGETGLLVPSKAPEQLADAVIRMLENPEQMTRMGDAGRVFVEENYNWQDILDDWVTTYEKAIDASVAMV